MTEAQTIEKPEAGTDLAIIGGTVTALTVFGADGGVDAILERITAQARAVVTDISTPAGRKAVASLAYKIARSKTALDAMGKDLGEQNYRAWKAITSERARIEAALDALAAEVRKPLTEYEEAEKARIAGHERELAGIPESIAFYENGYTTSEEFQVRLAFLNNPPPRDWQEFAKRAADVTAIEIAKTREALVHQLAFEAADAEAERLAREEAEAAAAREAERQRQRVIAAAEKARQEAEDRARVAAAAEARRVEQERVTAEARAAAAAEAVAEKARQERAAVEDRARKAEEDRIAAELKAGADIAAEAERTKIAQRRAEVAEAARIEVVARAKADAEAAAVRAADDIREASDRAALSERQRIADKQTKEAAQTAAREANTRHRGKVNSEAVDDLVAAVGITQAGARAVITAIVSGKVRHCRVSY